MEDSVGVEERREQSETTPHKRARQEVAESGGGSGGKAGEEGGFLSAVASKIGAAMSGANGANASGSVMETEEVRDQEVAGEQAGFLSAMATKIGMAVSGANGDDGSHVGTGEDDAKTSNGEANNGEGKKGEEANGGGGILSAVASRIGVAVSGGANANGNGNHSAEDGAKTSSGDAGHGTKGEEKEKEKEGDLNGGRIVEQIISKLPSDDQAPDADEASLLIHIIED